MARTVIGWFCSSVSGCASASVGGLSPEPAEETGRTIVYNPFAPATFAGGCCHNFGGMQVQDPPNSRYDIASFVTSPFAEATVWQGAASLELRVKSDCPDTAFYARVSLVRNNVAYGMRDDIVSLRPLVKLAGQVLAALIAIRCGLVFDTISNPNVFSQNTSVTGNERRMTHIGPVSFLDSASAS